MAHKILLIDDDRNFTEVATVVLTDENYEVHAVNDGSEGIERVRNCPPDLIVLDVLMPRMHGYEFIRALNAYNTLHKRPEIPVIVLTAKEEFRETFRHQGVKGYFVKPIEYSNLIEKIRDCLGAND